MSEPAPPPGSPYREWRDFERALALGGALLDLGRRVRRVEVAASAAVSEREGTPTVDAGAGLMALLRAALDVGIDPPGPGRPSVLSSLLPAGNSDYALEERLGSLAAAVGLSAPGLVRLLRMPGALWGTHPGPVVALARAARLSEARFLDLLARDLRDLATPGGAPSAVDVDAALAARREAWGEAVRRDADLILDADPPAADSAQASARPRTPRPPGAVR